MEPRLANGVTWICNHQQALIEKHLLGFALCHAVFLILASIAGIPFKPNNALDIHQCCILL